MLSNRSGSIRLFHLWGVDVFLHWSWFLVAVYEIQGSSRRYSSVAWNVLEYVALFLIVLLHEFGHAMACRQVGGVANRIVLWPLGGVAYVKPPQRPGAMLWSIAAGPLVNVALLPALIIAAITSRSMGWGTSHHDVYVLLRHILFIDIALLLFNMLPSYPLDGGQILRSLLWFMMGRGRSLIVATIVGIAGGIAMIGIAIWQQSFWTFAVALFMLVNCGAGLRHGRAIRRLEKLPRRDGFACPACETAPPIGNYWKCVLCGLDFDTFADGAVCPHCAAHHEATTCLVCNESKPMSEWVVSTAEQPAILSSSFETR